MLTVTIDGKMLPDNFGVDFDEISTRSAFDAKAFVENITFDNYKTHYQDLPQCSNNVVFKPHPQASDMTGSHNLNNTKCINC